MSSNLNVPVIIWYFKESSRDLSHTKKRLWRKACGNWFMFTNFSFKTVFWFLHVSVLEEKQVVMFLPVSLWHFVSPLRSERRGAFWIVWNCHYHYDSAEKEGEKPQTFNERNTSSAHTHTIRRPEVVLSRTVKFYKRQTAVTPVWVHNMHWHSQILPQALNSVPFWE